jgi:hypothetical protein
MKILCFSEGIQLAVKEWQSESLMHFGYGSINLLWNDPRRALENFQTAHDSIDKSDRSSCVMTFLVSLGQVIAYDNLGLRDHCERSISSIFFAINECEQKDSDEIGINENQPNSVDYEEAIEFLYELVSMTPSPDVRELLLGIVDDIEEKLFSTFKFSQFSYEGIVDWEFDCGKGDISIQQCKFWKKFKKWCREFVEFLGIVNDGYKKLKEFKDTHDNWNNK